MQTNFEDFTVLSVLPEADNEKFHYEVCNRFFPDYETQSQCVWHTSGRSVEYTFSA